MKLETLLAVVGADPIFESSLLLAGDVDPADVSKQLSRWTRSGTIWQMRRGLYCLAPPYRKIEPHPFLVANSLVPASYVSLQSALAFWQLIPEYAAAVTSVTTHGPRTFDTRLGRFELRHVKKGLFSGYRSIEVSPGQRAFVASPEKALLDLIHLTPGGDGEVYLSELRLQNLDTLDLSELNRLADFSGRPKLGRAVQRVTILQQAQTDDYETL